jgi:hypothetical protein
VRRGINRRCASLGIVAGCLGSFDWSGRDRHRVPSTCLGIRAFLPLETVDVRVTGLYQGYRTIVNGVEIIRVCEPFLPTDVAAALTLLSMYFQIDPAESKASSKYC